MNSHKGFTIIELMVVIAVITLLASIILVSLHSAQNKAKLARAKTEMSELSRSILIAQGEQASPLGYVTLSAHDCPSTPPGASCLCETNIDDPACLAEWQATLAEIGTAAHDDATILAVYEKDPWGHAYILDENEIHGSCAAEDTLRTYGATSDPADDYTITIPFSGYCIPP